MFGASSRPKQTQNRDGTNNVYCYQCGEFIAITYVSIQKAQCEMCRRVEAGEEITDEMVRAYKLAKGDRVDVTYLNLPEPDLRAVGLKKKFSFATMAGEVMAALGNFKLSGKDKQPEETPVQSAQIAKQKRRSRLFSNVKLGDKDSGQK